MNKKPLTHTLIPLKAYEIVDNFVNKELGITYKKLIELMNSDPEQLSKNNNMFFQAVSLVKTNGKTFSKIKNPSDEIISFYLNCFSSEEPVLIEKYTSSELLSLINKKDLHNIHSSFTVPYLYLNGNLISGENLNEIDPKLIIYASLSEVLVTDQSFDMLTALHILNFVYLKKGSGASSEQRDFLLKFIIKQNILNC